MKTPISELQALSNEERIDRSLERIVDRAVLDTKLQRALDIKWVQAGIEGFQFSDDEVDAYTTQRMGLGGSR